MQRITREQIENLRQLRRSGLTYPEIQAETGISKTAAHRYCADIPSQAMQDKIRARAHRSPPEWLPRVQDLLASGLSRLEIARALKISSSAIYRALPAGADEKKARATPEDDAG